MRNNSNFQTIIVSVLCLLWLMLGNMYDIVLWDSNVVMSAIYIMLALIILIPLCSCVLNQFTPVKDWKEALINVMVPLSFYYVLKMLEYNKVFVIIAVIVFLVLGIFVFEIRRRYVKRKIFSIVYFLRYIWCGIFVIILVPAHIHYRYDMPMARYFAEESKIAENVNTVNIYAIAGLNEDKWQNISNDERMDVLLDIMKAQANKLGIDMPAVTAINMEMTLTTAYYTHAERKIYFNSAYIKRDLKEVVDTALHELYHAYQNNVIDSLENVDYESIKKLSYYAKAVEWKEAKADYADDGKTYQGYSENALERDARSFAEVEVRKYKFE